MIKVLSSSGYCMGKSMTQEGLAKLAQIDRSNLQKIEAGKNFGVVLFMQICLALEISENELFRLANEEDYKNYRQKVLQEETEKQCTSDLTKCFFFLVQYK